MADPTDELRQGMNILVVEDDEDARENMRDILEMQNHRVSNRNTFAEALLTS